MATPNVVLIVVDALRADHLGTYGYARDVSPSIDALARRATVFESAIAQAPLTSVLQLMTSRYAQDGTIAADDRTLAEVLQDAGYDTAAVVDNPNFESTRDPHGLRRGFDTFYRNGLLDPTKIEQQHWKSKTPADAITAQAVRWLKRREGERPFFLWLHYFDPHDPYLPPFADDREDLSWNTASRYTGDIRATFLYHASRRRPGGGFTEADRQHLITLYDAEIRYVDQSLGELFAFFEARDLLDDALVVLTADHGESLGEHDTWTHGRSLYEPEVRIPLIIKYPRQARGRRTARPAQAIDVFPTVVDTVFGRPDPALDGRSLRREGTPPAFTFWRDWKVVRTAEWKLLERKGQRSLFRIARDPEERHDLAAEEPTVVAELAAAADRKLRELGTTEEELRARSNEVVERLRTLGYLE